MAKNTRKYNKRAFWKHRIDPGTTKGAANASGYPKMNMAHSGAIIAVFSIMVPFATVFAQILPHDSDNPQLQESLDYLVQQQIKMSRDIRLLKVSTGSSPSGAAGGDLSGGYPNPTVSHLGAISGASLLNINPGNISGGTANISITGSAGSFSGNINAHQVIPGVFQNSNYTFPNSVYHPGVGIWNSTGYIGIGTTSPSYHLQIIGDISSSSQAIVGGTVTVSGNAFSVGSSTLVVSNGNVGIGVTNPIYSLHQSGGLAYLSTAILAGYADVKSWSGYYQDGNKILGSGYGLNSTHAGIFAGGTSGTYNTIVGYYAGNANTGSNGTFLGYNAGRYSTGSQNTFIGYGTGDGVTTSGANNTVVGMNAATSLTSGSNNTILGMKAGFYTSSGGNNILIGYEAGEYTTTGSNNIIIANNVDLPDPTGSGQINIGNIIFGSGAVGTFGTGNVGIGISNPAYKLDVNGPLLTVGQQIITSSLTVLGDAFSVGESTLVVVNGRVGIGATAPVKALDVSGDLNLSDNSKMYANGELVLFSDSSSSNMFVGGSAGGSVTTSTSTTVFGANSGKNITSGYNNIILGSGNGSSLTTGHDTLLIGHNLNVSGGNQSYKLNIADLITGTLDPGAKTLYINSDGAASDVVLTLAQSASIEGNLQIDGVASIIGNTFSVGTDTFTVIDGNIGVGTTNPQYELQVVGAIQNNSSNTAVSFWGDGNNLTNLNGASIIGSLPLSSVDFSTITTQLNLKLTSPTVDGSVGWLLTTDGAGTPSWQPPSSASGLTFVVVSTPSDISGYTQMVDANDYTPSNRSTITVTNPTVGTYISSRATNIGYPGIVEIPAGYYRSHLHAMASVPNRFKLKFEVYIRHLDGTEVEFLEATDATPYIATTETAYETVGIGVSTNILITDRIVYKLKFTEAGSGTVSIYADGANSSESHASIELPSVAASVSNFVPYNGATKDVNLGSHNLSTSYGLSAATGVFTNVVTVSTGTSVSSLTVNGIIGFNQGLQTYGEGYGTSFPNVRGTGAIDLQTFRSAGTQVASGNYSVISGGDLNQAGGDESVVSGGHNNVANNALSTISGGSHNSTSGNYSSIIGGSGNTASGGYSAVLGGQNNKSMGEDSVSAGYNARANAQGSFAFADSQGTELAANTTDQFIARFQGGFYWDGSETVTGSQTTAGTMTVQGNAFSVGGSTLVVTNGKIGILTTTPTAKLSFGSGGNNIFMDTSDGSDNGLIQIGGGGLSGTNRGGYINAFGNEYPAITSGTIQFFSGTGSGSGSNIEFYTDQGGGPTQKIIIQPSGNVGIGTTNPGAVLHVVGASTFTGNAFFYFDVSALTFTDRAASPKDLSEAYLAIESGSFFKNSENFAQLHPAIRSENKIEKYDDVKKSTETFISYGRNLSSTVSALAEIVKDLNRRIKELEKR